MHGGGRLQTGHAHFFFVPQLENVGGFHEIAADLAGVFADGGVYAVLDVVLLRGLEVEVESCDVREGNCFC